MNDPVPDLFCPEILSDLEEIENYYIEHLKHQTPCESLLNHISADDNSQDVPQCEPSLIETWDESWWNNSQPHDDLLTADEDSPSLASQDVSTASAYSPYKGSVGNLEPQNETCSQLLNEIDNCLGCYDEESQGTPPSVVPTMDSADYAILNLKTNYLLAVVPSLITTADLLLPTSTPTDDYNQATVSFHVESLDRNAGTSSGHGNYSCENLIPDSVDASELVSGEESEAQATNDNIEEDDMVPSENLQPATTQNRPTNAQVVPNLQMLLLAHSEADCAAEDDNESEQLEFHRSQSQSGDAYDSQVVPLWDQEE